MAEPQYHKATTSSPWDNLHSEWVAAQKAFLKFQHQTAAKLTLEYYAYSAR